MAHGTPTRTQDFWVIDVQGHEEEQAAVLRLIDDPLQLRQMTYCTTSASQTATCHRTVRNPIQKCWEMTTGWCSEGAAAPPTLLPSSSPRSTQWAALGICRFYAGPFIIKTQHRAIVWTGLLPETDQSLQTSWIPTMVHLWSVAEEVTQMLEEEMHQATA